MAYTGIQAPFLDEAWVETPMPPMVTFSLQQAANTVPKLYVNRAYNSTLGAYHHWPSDGAPDPTMATTEPPGLKGDYTDHLVVSVADGSPEVQAVPYAYMTDPSYISAGPADTDTITNQMESVAGPVTIISISQADMSLGDVSVFRGLWTAKRNTGTGGDGYRISRDTGGEYRLYANQTGAVTVDSMKAGPVVHDGFLHMDHYSGIAASSLENSKVSKNGAAFVTLGTNWNRALLVSLDRFALSGYIYGAVASIIGSERGHCYFRAVIFEDLESDRVALYSAFNDELGDDVERNMGTAILALMVAIEAAVVDTNNIKFAMGFSEGAVPFYGEDPIFENTQYALPAGPPKHPYYAHLDPTAFIRVTPDEAKVITTQIKSVDEPVTVIAITQADTSLGDTSAYRELFGASNEIDVGGSLWLASRKSPSGGELTWSAFNDATTLIRNGSSTGLVFDGGLTVVQLVETASASTAQTTTSIDGAAFVNMGAAWARTSLGQLDKFNVSGGARGPDPVTPYSELGQCYFRAVILEDLTSSRTALWTAFNDALDGDAERNMHAACRAMMAAILEAVGFESNIKFAMEFQEGRLPDYGTYPIMNDVQYAPPGGVPDYTGLYSVSYDGATEAATNIAASAASLDQHASGAVAVWVRGTDAVGTFFSWTDATGDDQVTLLPGAGGACRMLVQMNTGVQVDTTGTTAIDDAAWHLIGLSWTWASGCQLYVDGVAEGALDACTDAWPVTPAMDDIFLPKSDWAGQVGRCAIWNTVKDAAWWARLYIDTKGQWPNAIHDWRMGDTQRDRPGLVTIADVRGGLDLTTTGIVAANLTTDHPV